jgi:type I pantothenate kinase
MTFAADRPGPTADLADIARRLVGLRPDDPPFIIGITGSVAVGKSTFAAALASVLPRAGMGGIEIAGSDGFLLPNAVLDARGLTLRKGFPDSFDAEALGRALVLVRRGGATFPGYCHVTYDVDPGLGRRIERPDALIVEGLGLGPHRPLIDALVYLDAAEVDLEAWFLTRFMAMWDGAEHDPSSFYVRFRNLDRAAAIAFARSVWTAINLPNLREHIAPQRALADIVIRKGPDHEIAEIIGRHGQAAPL